MALPGAPPKRRLLVIRLGAVGDVIRTIPARPLLRRHEPSATLCWVTEEGPARLLAGHRDLDEVIVLPRKTIARLLSRPWTLPRGVGETVRFARALRAGGWDVALDFHGTFKSGLVCVASGAPQRWGYEPPGSKEGNRLFTNRRVAIPSEPIHRIERNLALVRAFGAPADRVTVELPIRPAHRDRVRRWLAQEALGEAGLVLLYPGTSRRQAWKRPPPQLLGEAGRLLASDPRLSLLVAGGPGEQALVEAVAAAAGPGKVRIVPDLDLLELAALLERCRLFIGPDTGPMHLAWAAGCRVLAVFGPTDPRLNAPWGSGHRVLYNAASRSGRVAWPDPREIARAASEMLREENAPRPGSERSTG